MGKLYQNLFETSQENIFIVNRDTDEIIDANRSACELYGYTKEEFLRLKNTNISADPEETRKSLKNRIIDIPLHYHFKKDGTRFPVEISVNYFDLDGNSYLTNIVKDLSNRKNIDQSLIDANILHNTIFDRSPLAMAFLDIDDNIRMWNHSAERMFGWVADEVLEKPNPIIPKEKKEEFEAVSGEVFNQGAISGREMICQRKDGSLIHVNLSSSVVYNQEGQTIGRMAIIEEISERKRIEELLAENETVFSSFLEHSPIYVFFKDKEIRALRLSKNFEQMLGMPVKDALGKTMEELFPSDLARRMVADDLMILNEGKRVDVIEELNGRIFSTIKFPILKDGQPYILAGFTQDITEHKQLTEQLEMLKLSIDLHFDSAFWIDTDNRFVYVNDAACASLKYTREELLKMDVADVNLQATPETMDKIWKKLRLDRFYRSKGIHRRKDGTEFPVEVVSTYVKFGNKEYNCGFASDISEKVAFEDALLLERNQLRTLIDNLPDSIFFKNVEGKYLLNNLAHLHSLGQEKQEDVFGKTAFDLHQKMFAEQFINDELEIIKSGKALNDKEESVFREDTKELRWHLTSKIPIKDSQGKVISIVGISRDITERKKMEESLKMSEERLRLALEGANDGIWDVNMVTEDVYMSPRGCEILGYNHNEIAEITRVWSNLVCPDDLQLTQERLKDYFEGQTPIFEVEQRLKMKSGELKWILTRGKVAEWLPNGKPLRMIGTHTDISIRRQIEEALKTSEEKYRLLFENMIAGFALHEMIYDLEGNPLDYKFLEINPAFEKLTGLKAAAMVGKRVLEVLPNTEPYWIKTYGEVAKTGVPASFQNYSQELAKYYDVWVFSPQKDQFAVVFSDITNQKNNEEALKHQNDEYQSLNEEYVTLNEELLDSNNRLIKINKELEKAKVKAEESDNLKTAFLCNMSHEIRTPMNAILGFSEFITQPNLEESKKVLFSKLIKDRTYDLLRIIEDILDISKIEIGQMSIIESETDIKNLIMDLFDYYKMRKENQKPNAPIKISLNIDSNLKNPNIIVDGSRLKQILMNLLDNSLKFTKEGSIEIGCSVIGGSEILFTIEDTGIGIQPDRQEIVFDRFRQAEDLHTARHFGGTGLGLSIAKGLSILMGGKIWFESEFNIGTKFYVSIPYKISAMSEIKIENTIQQPSLQWENKTFLIVEDDPSSAELINEIICPTHARIINAYTGEEAMEAIQNNKNIDLVLLDIRLPDANGLTIAHDMKIINPNMLIIAQTAYASESDAKECIDAGCNGYISKPIQPEKLLTLIHQFLY